MAAVHVIPLDDLARHERTSECVCGPDVEYYDPLTGHSYPNGPVVFHHSLDGREAHERTSAKDAGDVPSDSSPGRDISP